MSLNPEEKSASCGDIVDLLDGRGNFLGRGYFNPHSQIRVRVLSWAQESIDQNFLRQRIKLADRPPLPPLHLLGRLSPRLFGSRPLARSHPGSLRALKLLESGGILLTYSCSYHLSPYLFLQMVEEAASDSGRRVHLLEFHTQAPDHPILLGVPETCYLKCAILRVV